MKRKLLSLLAILMMAVANSNAMVYEADISNPNLAKGESTTVNGIVIKINNGDPRGIMSGNWSPGEYIISAASGETITGIEITTSVQNLISSDWTQTSPGLVWSGSATSVNLVGEPGDASHIKVTAGAANTPVTSVTLSPTTSSLTAGGAALELTPTVVPGDATDKTVKWSVEQEGSIVALYTDQACTQAVGTDAIDPAKVYVKPLAAGQATVTVASNADASLKATCTVTVAAAEPTYNVTFKEGTEDVGNWTIDPASAKQGQTVTVKYTGTKKVKSVKAVKKAAEPASPFAKLTVEDLA